ncbi:MAG: sulfotransferase [Phycisphaerales bacterium]|nr:sulfotransferase [Phycisphaerales bacterium]
MSSLLTPNDPLTPAYQLIRAERFDEAVALLMRMKKKDRSNPQICFYLGIAEAQRGAINAARNHFRDAVKLRPGLADYHQELGMACRLSGRYDEAHRAFDEALKLSPGTPHIVASKAATFRLQGRYDEAIALLEPFADDPPHDRRFALVYGGLAHRMGREAQAVKLLEEIEAASRASDRSRASIVFTLAALRDRMGEYDAAFADFMRANELYGITFNPERFAQRVDEFMALWSVERFLELPRARAIRESQQELPVFIVGMPRSGTSLTEQIIASHPEAFGAGELDDLNRGVLEVEGAPFGFEPLTRLEFLTQAKVEKMARQYLTTVSKLERSAARITDKMPQNFIHLGLIALLFPHGRVLHTRRDPLDTCLSCFFQEFSPRLTFTFDLINCGHYYRQYQRLMDHWMLLYQAARDAGIPTPEVTEVVYEDLTARQDEESRRLIEALGLEWDEGCLRFHETSRTVATASSEQVRQPMYRTSVQRHRNYEGHLDDLRAVLA